MNKGSTAPILRDYGNWWRVEVSDRVGYVHKNSVRLGFLNSDRNFEVVEDEVIIYDNRSGKLNPVGVLKKGQVFSRVSDYGNWHKVKFGHGFGYVNKMNTVPTSKPVLDENKNLLISDIYFQAMDDLIVYQSPRVGEFVKIKKGQQYPIISDFGKWLKVDVLGRIGYVNKQDLLILKFNEYKKVGELGDFSIINDHLIEGPLNSNFLRSAELMLNDEYVLPRYSTFNEPILYRNGILWEGRKGDTRSYLRLLHSLTYVYDLIAAYEETGDRKYIDKGSEIILDWIKKNPYGNSANIMAWHDEGSALRLEVMVTFFEAAKDILPSQTLDVLFQQILFHAELLASDSFYSKNTNHGMFQDEALLVFSDYFISISDKLGYNEIVNTRFKDYFDYIISDEGVHLEHSPAYHQVISRALKKYKDYYYTHGDSDYSLYLNSLYNSMAHYATYVIKPDGNWPLLGDTFATDRPSALLWENDLNYQYARTNGLSGLPPKEVDAVYLDAGYAIFRDSWEKGKSGTYVNFTAAYHTGYHKHSDDLSVTIYSDGDIITEAGPNGYEYDDPFTSYGYSSYAHNTLIVDDRGLPRVDGKFESTYLINSQLLNNYASATGVNKRYEGVTHLRNVEYYKENKLISVSDQIVSKERHNYKLLWNLEEDIQPELDKDNGSINLYRDGIHVMKINVFSEDALIDINIVSAQSSPLMGWKLGFNNGGGKPTKTIVVETDSRVANIKTAFQLVNAN